MAFRFKIEYQRQRFRVVEFKMHTSCVDIIAQLESAGKQLTTKIKFVVYEESEVKIIKRTVMVFWVNMWHLIKMNFLRKRSQKQNSVQDCTKCGIEFLKKPNKCSEQKTTLCSHKDLEDDDIYYSYCGSLTTYAL